MVDFPPDRYQLVGEEFEKPYFTTLVTELKTRKTSGEIIYPPGADIFRAFRLTPLAHVQVIILGQDPYHGPGQAHGLSFSVPEGITPPPSLKNIFTEISTEYDLNATLKSWNLTHRAEQGVLLLNAILTVKAGSPASHHGLGREQFTDAVISKLSTYHEHLVFLLRGAFARSKKSLIDTAKHLILETSHPSPFSVRQGFAGCGHFRTANEYLLQHWKKPIQRQ